MPSDSSVSESANIILWQVSILFWCVGYICLWSHKIELGVLNADCGVGETQNVLLGNWYICVLLVYLALLKYKIFTLISISTDKYIEYGFTDVFWLIGELNWSMWFNWHVLIQIKGVFNLNMLLNSYCTMYLWMYVVTLLLALFVW